MITKNLYRDQVRDFLLNQVKSGEIRPGANLSLAKISRHLEVSVTPIREALTQLQHSRLVEIIPNRGFFLSSLKIEEAREIYTMIGVIEKFLLENSEIGWIPIKKLETLVQAYEDEKDPIKRLELDNRLHDVLLQGIVNDTAHSMLQHLKSKVSLYELEYMKHPSYTPLSDNSHKKILSTLKKGDVAQAAQLLEEHWTLSLFFIENYLTESL